MVTPRGCWPCCLFAKLWPRAVIRDRYPDELLSRDLLSQAIAVRPILSSFFRQPKDQDSHLCRCYLYLCSLLGIFNKFWYCLRTKAWSQLARGRHHCKMFRGNDEQSLPVGGVWGDQWFLSLLSAHSRDLAATAAIEEEDRSVCNLHDWVFVRSFLSLFMLDVGTANGWSRACISSILGLYFRIRTAKSHDTWNVGIRAMVG